MSATQKNEPKPDKDEILEIFFDENFVPQAFVDILLSSTKAQDQCQLQHTSSALLSRLDFYTRHLTSELESTIWNLEKLSERLPGTWDEGAVQKSVGSDDVNSIAERYIDSQMSGASKLEYYLDTLGSAVRSVESDIQMVDNDLSQLNEQFTDDTDVIEQTKQLELVRGRLNDVLKMFRLVQSICGISGSDATKKQQDGQNVSLEDFKLSLSTLAETISESLNKAQSEESAGERNAPLLDKVDNLIRLAPMFKGLGQFYDVYEEFSNNISKESQRYLRTKDIEGDFDI